MLGVTAVFLAVQPAGAGSLFNGMIATDGFATFFKWLFLLAAALTVLISAPGKDFPPQRIGEFYGLMMAMMLGLFLMASATDLLMVYLSIELVSLCSYVLAGFKKGDRRAAEASLKYVIYGGVASGVMLFGMSYLYGLLGTTSLGALFGHIQHLQATGLPAAATKLTLVVAMVLVTAGVGYKIAAVPWHMWCPDVYEGAPTPFTAFLSVGPKAAGFAVALRLFYGALSGPSAVTAGLRRGGGRRPLAGHHRRHGGGHHDARQPDGAGADQPEAPAGLLVDRPRRLHAHGALGRVGSRHAGHHDLHADLRGDEPGRPSWSSSWSPRPPARSRSSTTAGLAKRHPLAATTFAIFLFSLTGIPPFAGFVGKWYLFVAVLDRVPGPGGNWYAVLAIIGAVNSAISLYYYARVIRAMFIDAALRRAPAGPGHPVLYQLLLSASAVAVLVFGVWWTPMVDWTVASLHIFKG